MSEDETFIRAIVDAPGDDLPRLVYADWLDDRDDPRGAYLRAEREAVETGDVAPLRELAVGLDPVWVARVSMPPIGVCIEHVELTHRGPQVDKADVAEVERRLGILLPAEYRAFLLNYNGGFVDASLYFDTPDGPRAMHECGWSLDSLLGVEKSRKQCADYFRAHPTDPSIVAWLNRFVFIGHDPDVIGSIILGVHPPDEGNVWVYDSISSLAAALEGYQSGQLPYAGSFPAFLSYLPYYPRDGSVDQ